LLQGGDLEKKVTNLMCAREQIYMETAHVEVITDGKNPKKVVEEILTLE
jgi:shikimate kinase